MGERFHDPDLGKGFLGETRKSVTVKEKKISVIKIKNKCSLS